VRAKGWSQFCFAKLLLAHAAWIERKSFLPPGGKKIEAESLAGRIFVSATRI
jgi:hypothetical protein